MTDAVHTKEAGPPKEAGLQLCLSRFVTGQTENGAQSVVMVRFTSTSRGVPPAKTVGSEVIVPVS